MKNQTAFFFLKMLSFSIVVSFFTACEEGGDGPDTAPPRACETISEDIEVTTTLVDLNEDPAYPDYCITSKIHITDGAGLIIEPGVVIEFAEGAGIDLGLLGISKGYLIAEGTADRPIIFTGEAKIPGFWRGILVPFNSSDVRSKLDHCIIEYAGSGNLGNGASFRAGLGVAKSTNGTRGLISLTNSIIRHTDGKGYACHDCSGLNEFGNNHFESNSQEAIYLNAYGFSKMDNNTTFLNNGTDGVSQTTSVFSDRIDDDQVHTIQPLSGNNVYHVNKGIRLESGGLKILAGAKFVMADAQKVWIEAGTFLEAIGTSSNPIIFRGRLAGTPSWNAIYFKSFNTNNQLSYCDISEAGVGIIRNNTCHGTASIGLDYWFGTGANANINNCNITDGGGCGIFTDEDNAGNITQSGNTFLRLAGTDICN